MYSSQEWFSNTEAGGGGDPGDPIGQSLRIIAGNGTSGTPVLNRPVVSPGSRSWTWSGWCKWTFEMLTLFTPCSSTGASSGLWVADQLWFQNASTSQADSWRSFGSLRDESAWYHIVFSVDVDNNITRGWINGVEAGNANVVNNTYMQFNGTMGFQNGQRNNWSGDGYIADVYLIDGQALEPTVFGRYNANDVWVPVAPEGLTFGANGFHLDFSDPNDIGADRSGNGNHFTATGFNTLLSTGALMLTNDGGTPTQLQALGTLTLGTLPQDSTANRGQIYDLDFGSEVESFTQTYRSTNMENRWMQLFTSNTGDANDWTQIDERQFGPSANTPYDIHVDFPSPARYLRITQTATQGATWQTGVWNIQFLNAVNNPDYDLMQDSPTQNYATGNPLMVGIDGGTLIHSFTRANLGWNGMNAGGALPFGYASIRIPMGVRAYCEWQATQATTASIGVSERRPTEDRAWGSAGAWSWGIDTRSWITEPDGTNGTAPGNWTNNPGAIASAEVNTTVTPPTVTFRLNGDDATAETRTFNADFDSENIWFGGNASNGAQVAMNFGQQPFLHQPADTVALQTANLPEPTIRNGRDHFRAITGPGQGDGQAFNEGNIGITDPVVLTNPIPTNQAQSAASNSLVVDLFGEVNTVDIQWNNTDATLNTILLSIDGTNWRNIGEETISGGATVTYSDGADFRYVRQWRSTVKSNGIMSAAGVPILQAAQQTFENGLYIIKSRTDSEQWQYFDTINGDTSVPRTPANTAPQTYFSPAGTALAWCWSAPDAFTNADVTAGRSNVAAGFSMVNYTGDGADLRTITHGLDRAPGLIIHFNPAGGDVKVWITGLTGTGRDTQNLVLNTGEAASNQFSAGAIHAPENDTEMIVGRNADPGGTGIAGVNDNGALYRAFIWAPIPGYSAFGNFTGAGGPGNDAPFIYTGFKPALVWIQASGEGGGDSFFTADTTCQTFNPYGGDTLVNMAQSNAEGVNSARPWDMLSNGFKIRTNSGSLNRTNVVWAAWAENPFSSPATAR